MPGNAIDRPKSKSRKFFTVVATTCGKNRRNRLISCISYLSLVDFTSFIGFLHDGNKKKQFSFISINDKMNTNKKIVKSAKRNDITIF